MTPVGSALCRKARIQQQQLIKGGEYNSPPFTIRNKGLSSELLQMMVKVFV